MADEIITREQLVNASLDADSLELFISGSDSEDVLTRLGQNYPTLAKLILMLMETGGFEPFLTEAALKASVPTVPKKAAFAMDTGTIWYWNGSAWAASFLAGKTLINKRLEGFVAGTNGAVNWDSATRTLSWNNALIFPYAQASTRRIQIAAGSVTFSGTAYEVLYLDTTQIPSTGTIATSDFANCLKIAAYNNANTALAFADRYTQIPLAKFTPQNGIEPCTGFPKIITGKELKDTFTYNKIADRITIYLPASNGNLIKYLFRHNQDASIQQDIWRLERAIETNTALVDVQEIVTYGEWEFTMRETAYPDDHVGGVHGDELLTSALFLVDGVYKDPMTWTGSGEAKEIRFQQVSNIYRRNTQIPIAKHFKEDVITKDGITVLQSVEMLVTTNADRFWFAMLPIFRVAANSVQVTKRDIRDGVIRDVTNAGFTQVYTPLKNGSYVNVSGDKYTGSVKLSNINGALPTADIYVSNDTAYNKIYVSAIGGASSGVTLNAGQKFEWSTTYEVNAN
ncbi:hypothetical protein R4611_02355 [Acinetobacter baumannii]|nr:hypothetical protein [Acinetobacter baumannii]